MAKNRDKERAEQQIRLVKKSSTSVELLKIMSYEYWSSSIIVSIHDSDLGENKMKPAT